MIVDYSTKIDTSNLVVRPGRVISLDAEAYMSPVVKTMYEMWASLARQFDDVPAALQPSPKEHDMPLFEVAYTLVPNIKAQESGAEETLLVGPVAVVAKEMASAAARVAADHADLLKATDGSTLRTHIRQFPTVA